MPAHQRGEVRTLANGRKRLRYSDADGRRVNFTERDFANKTEALRFYRQEIEPRLHGGRPAVDHTLAAFTGIYLDQHAANVRPQTIDKLRSHLRRALAGVRRRASLAP